MRRALHRIEYRRVAIITSWTIALILGLGLLFALSPQLERAVLTGESVRSASPISEGQALERHSDVRDYLFGADTIEGASASEVSHMRDVRRLIEILAGIALAFVALGLGGMRATPKSWNRGTVRSIALSIIGVTLGVAIIGLFAFGQLFEVFHFLLFPQGNWQFAADSFLITLYPQVFFAQMAAAIGVLLVLSAGVAYLLARPRAL